MMFTNKLSLVTIPLLVAAIISVSHALRPVPDFIHVCHGNDPQLSACMVHSIESLRPLLAAGIPEMNVPSIEPMDVGNLLVTKRATPNGLQVTANNIKAYNASLYEVYDMKVVELGRIYTFNTRFKTMYVTGKYTIEGHILVLPIQGAGKFTGTFVNAVSNNTVIFGQEIIDGVPYIRITKVETHITLKEGRINLQNLFNGDRVLGDVINETINQNFALFAEDLIPLVQQALNKMFMRIGNRITNAFTVDQFFPKT